MNRIFVSLLLAALFWLIRISESSRSVGVRTA